MRHDAGMDAVTPAGQICAAAFGQNNSFVTKITACAAELFWD